MSNPPPKITKLCPDCGHPLILRTNRQNGSQFLGCQDYPTCKHTEPVPESYLLRLQGVKDMFEEGEP